MKGDRTTGMQYGVSILFLWAVLLAVIPDSGYTGYSHRFPVTYGVEQVYFPSSGTTISTDYHLDTFSGFSGAVQGTISPEYQLIQKAIHRTISVHLQFQEDRFIEIKGALNTLFRIIYAPDSRDHDDRLA